MLQANLKKRKYFTRSAALRAAFPADSLRTDEEVFLAQLYRRALLLNEGFHAKVLQVIHQHEAPIRRTESGMYESLGASAVQVFSLESQESNPTASLVFVHGKDPRLFDRIPSNSSALTSTSDFKSSAMGSALAALKSSELDTSTFSDCSATIYCDFAEGVGAVEVHPAPVKK
jgi:hypothetical protein